MNLLLRRWTWELAANLAGITGALILIMAAALLLRLMGDMVEGHLPLLGMAQLLVLEFPQLLMLVLPLSSAVAASLCLGRWWQSSEVVAARYCGLSARVTRMPVWILAAAVVPLQAWVGTFWVPYADEAAHQLRAQYRSELVLGWVYSGVVHGFHEGPLLAGSSAQHQTWRLAAAEQLDASLRDVVVFRSLPGHRMKDAGDGLPDARMTQVRAPTLEMRPCTRDCLARMEFPGGAQGRSFGARGEMLSSWRMDSLRAPLGQVADRHDPGWDHEHAVADAILALSGALCALTVIMLAVVLAHPRARARIPQSTPVTALATLLYMGVCVGYTSSLADEIGQSPGLSLLGVFSTPGGGGLLALWLLPIAGMLGWGVLQSREWR